MSIAEPRTFYFLEEVFELLGTHLYGSTWTGWEITARPVDDPDESEQRRSELNAQIESSAAKMTAFDERIDATVDAATIKRLQDRRAAQQSKHSDLHIALVNLPMIDDAYRRRHGAFHRRQNAERILIGAFAQNDLHAWAVRGREIIGIPEQLWQDRKGFQYYLELSLAVLPRDVSGVRRGTVKIRTAEFQSWLMTIERVIIEPGTQLAPEERAIIWFLRFIEEQSGAWPKRDYVIHLMKLEVRELSGAGALRVWRAHAPKHWKRSGPRPAKIR